MRGAALADCRQTVSTVGRHVGRRQVLSLLLYSTDIIAILMIFTSIYYIIKIVIIML